MFPQNARPLNFALMYVKLASETTKVCGNTGFKVLRTKMGLPGNITDAKIMFPGKTLVVY